MFNSEPQVKSKNVAEGTLSGKKARREIFYQAKLLAEGLKEAILSGNLLNHLSAAGTVEEELAELQEWKEELQKKLDEAIPTANWLPKLPSR